MSRSLNRVMLIGNLGADPESRTITSTGEPRTVTNFSLATSRSWRGADGQLHEKTQWHRVVAWGNRGEFAATYLKKGNRVYVEGELEYRSYEDKDGVTRYVTEINAREVLALNDRPASEPSTAKQAARVASIRQPKVAAHVEETDPFDLEDDDLPF